MGADGSVMRVGAGGTRKRAWANKALVHTQKKPRVDLITQEQRKKQLTRIMKLLDKAESCERLATPEGLAEAEAARRRAETLMTRAGIRRQEVEALRWMSGLPEISVIHLHPPFAWERAQLLDAVATLHNVKVIIVAKIKQGGLVINVCGFVDDIKAAIRQFRDLEWQLKVTVVSVGHRSARYQRSVVIGWVSSVDQKLRRVAERRARESQDFRRRRSLVDSWVDDRYQGELNSRTRRANGVPEDGFSEGRDLAKEVDLGWKRIDHSPRE